MITYLGSLSIGDALPGAVSLSVAGMAGINAALPDILGRIAALQAFAPSPVSFQAQLALANQVVQSVQASISLGLSPPSIAAQLAAVAALIAELLAAVQGIHAQLAILQDFSALFGAAGVHALAYAGTAGSMGGELGGALASVPGLSPFDACHGVVLVTTVPATWAALGQIVKVTP